VLVVERQIVQSATVLPRRALVYAFGGTEILTDGRSIMIWLKAASFGNAVCQS